MLFQIFRVPKLDPQIFSKRSLRVKCGETHCWSGRAPIMPAITNYWPYNTLGQVKTIGKRVWKSVIRLLCTNPRDPQLHLKDYFNLIRVLQPLAFGSSANTLPAARKVFVAERNFGMFLYYEPVLSYQWSIMMRSEFKEGIPLLWYAS